jgi:hypothetical protein
MHSAHFNNNAGLNCPCAHKVIQIQTPVRRELDREQSQRAQYDFMCAADGGVPLPSRHASGTTQRILGAPTLGITDQTLAPLDVAPSVTMGHMQKVYMGSGGAATRAGL